MSESSSRIICLEIISRKCGVDTAFERVNNGVPVGGLNYVVEKVCILMNPMEGTGENLLDNNEITDLACKQNSRRQTCLFKIEPERPFAGPVLDLPLILATRSIDFMASRFRAPSGALLNGYGKILRVHSAGPTRVYMNAAGVTPFLCKRFPPHKYVLFRFPGDKYLFQSKTFLSSASPAASGPAKETYNVRMLRIYNTQTYDLTKTSCRTSHNSFAVKTAPRPSYYKHFPKARSIRFTVSVEFTSVHTYLRINMKHVSSQ